MTVSSETCLVTHSQPSTLLSVRGEIVRTIPPSGIILTIKALQIPSFPPLPNSNICLELGPSPTTGKISFHRVSFGLIFTFSRDPPSWRKANTWDSGASLPEKWEVSIST
jgi:hypothetical protein